MSDNNNNNNQPVTIPYGNIAIAIFIFGMICAYLMIDLYSQRKADMSIIKVINTIQQQEDLKQIKLKSSVIDDDNITITTYKLYINGTEHNFSFTNFNIQNLKLDGTDIDYTIQKKEKHEKRNE